MRRLLLAAIGGYQRLVSPHKGFRCACPQHKGRIGCSALGARAIRRFGAGRGVGALRPRLAPCRIKHRRRGTGRPLRHAQAGDCDRALPCEAPPGCSAAACDAASRCDCATLACDFGRGGRGRAPARARGVAIPPHSLRPPAPPDSPP